MKKFIMLTALAFSFSQVFASVSVEPLLNKITLQLNSEQWLTTKTALVYVAINAAVSDQGIETIQDNVMKKLGQLSAKGEWHLMSFNRQLDKSGLESIQMMAQARLAQTELGNLRDKAKAMSKPGETFTIDNVQFVPSEEEIRQASTSLRENIYQQAKAEIDVLNKNYPDQKYYLHQIDFMFPPSPMAQPVAAMAMNGGYMKMGGEARSPLSVGNKLNVQATVIVASFKEGVVSKITTN